MPPRRSPLFPAVVLAGVSLATACGDDDNGPITAGDASTDARAEASADASVDASSDAALDAASDACPPDAELPTPPCYLIK